IVWLFEPRRSSKVKHWSGTNEYPAWHQSKLGSTLSTFAHYAYLFSQESTILADLQSVLYLFPSGSALTKMARASVLFNVMTHTLDGSSGVGDHGKPGIKTFLEKHECVNRCKYLGLSRDGFQSDSEPPAEESDDD
ncbi:kinase-like domain-containing protein, partial [Mycena epipterygia]